MNKLEKGLLTLALSTIVGTGSISFYKSINKQVDSAAKWYELSVCSSLLTVGGEAAYRLAYKKKSK